MFFFEKFENPGPSWILLNMIIIIITHQMKWWYVWSSVVQNQEKKLRTEIDRWKCMRMSLSQALQCLSLITCWNAELPNRKSDLTVTICLISAGVMSSCKRWIQTVHGMKLKLCTSFFTFSNSSFQFLTFPYFLAFLFFPLDSWQGLEVKRCCGQLWNVESASGADLEPIRAQERRGQERERERERIVKVWMGFTKRVKGGEDGEKETVRGGVFERGTLGEQELREVLATERGITLLLPAGYLLKQLI